MGQAGPPRAAWAPYLASLADRTWWASVPVSYSRKNARRRGRPSESVSVQMPWPSGRMRADQSGGERAGGGALGFGPPPLEAGAGMGAGVAGEVGEEAVDAEAVVQGAGGGDPADAVGGGGGPWWGLAAGGGDVQGAEVGQDVVPGVGAAAGSQWPEPVDQASAVQAEQAALGEPGRAEQGVGDLRGGEDVVVGEPAEQALVAIGKAGLQAEDGVGAPGSPGPGGGDPQGSFGSAPRAVLRPVSWAVG